MSKGRRLQRLLEWIVETQPDVADIESAAQKLDAAIATKEMSGSNNHGAAVNVFNWKTFLAAFTNNTIKGGWVPDFIAATVKPRRRNTNKRALPTASPGDESSDRAFQQPRLEAQVASSAANTATPAVNALPIIPSQPNALPSADAQDVSVPDNQSDNWFNDFSSLLWP